MPHHVAVIDVPKGNPLLDYRDFPGLTPIIDGIEKQASRLKKKVKGRRIWMLNSTASGGGVAEMMPTMINLFRDLQVPVSWIVMKPEDPAFFLLTKKIHHLLHGRDEGGVGISKQEKTLYRLDSERIAGDLENIVDERDLLIVHDPQPLGAGAVLSERRSRQCLLWRCHIGTEFKNKLTRVVWQFLGPYLKHYRRCFFTHPDYIPASLKKKSATLYPAIDPLSPKNMWLSSEEQVEILRMAGLYTKRRRGFKKKVLQLTPEGGFKLPEGFHPLLMPIILQISRWDHLKGFIPLMKGFLYMKRKAKHSHYRGLKEITRRMIKESVLVLAGPEVGAVADDPEPELVLEEIKRFYKTLTPREQRQIFIFLLPMTNKRENALIVNALQRSAEVIVQNSIREGFGLTVTEALWKEVPVIATNVGGIRLQVQDNSTGLIVNDPHNARELGERLLYLLTHKRERMRLARRGWLHAEEHYLMPALIKRYLDIFEKQL